MSAGKPLSSQARETQRTLEAYLAKGAPPRWMERYMSVENGLKRARADLAERHAALRAEDPERFAERWHAYAHTVRYDELNDLVRKHNRYYPMERDLPMNPRTGEYVTAHGRSFLRPEVTPAWILEQFPAD